MKVNQYILRLEHAGIINSQQETLWIMSHALGVNSSQILAKNNFSHDELNKINALISRRESGEPLQYIFGEADFFTRDFVVGEGVLIPRHDTETLINAVMKYIDTQEKFVFIDFGTGSGCIAITILLEYINSFAYMIEKSDEAKKYAKINLEKYNLNQRAKIISGFDELDIHECRFIISNPPYIPSNEISGLMKTVRDYEPLLALDGGLEGMRFYDYIFSEAKKIKCDYIILEIGNMKQIELLKHKHLCIDEIFDDNDFPRCLIFCEE